MTLIHARPGAHRLTAARRRGLAVAATVPLGLVASLTTFAGPASAESTGAQQPRPLVSLRRTVPKVELASHRNRVWLDLGTYLVAGDVPFEVRTTRTQVAPYRHPITTTVSRPDSIGGDVVLPDGMVRNFRGLPRFVRIRIVDRDGTVVKEISRPFCGGYESIRTRPDATDTNVYPYGCWGANPFTLGGVQGLPAGWGTPVLDPWSARAKLPLGRYTARLSIGKSYREALGLSRATSTASVRVRVVEGQRGDCEELCFAADPSGVERAEDTGSRTPSAVPTEPAASEPARAATGTPPDSAKADLRSVPAFGIGVVKGHFLAFGATVWNRGPSPLVVDGFRRRGEDVMAAYQYFYDADGASYGHQPVGTMEWDERDGHHHWHFTDFARYRLLGADKKAVVRSKKEAFCLANTDMIDYTVPGANWRPEATDLHSACGGENALGVREVLDTGSGDTYSQYRPGQSFDLSGLQPGKYFIEVTANPRGTLVETDTDNNTALRKVRIGGAADAERRTVRVFDVGLVHTR